ncbi:MAG: sigma 54-interacting transcriptional regulator [Deltaproteobacteria bacterium]|nr:sigma 54-interacting transcriptional regulator [Deltaproteobacteria bacterium]
MVRLPETGEVVAGRAEDASLSLASASVSRRHARFEARGDGTWVSDLGSHNGTLINGKRIEGEVRLQDGDIVCLGEVTLAHHARALRPRELPEESLPVEVLPVGDRELVIADATMARIYALVRRLAAAGLPVLVCGETGSGKDLAAAAIHHWSPRASHPLVALNCAALQDNLVESELFGFARGAFTGAVNAKPGLFETATGGTLFLDEVGELSPATQAKLLRALETKKVARLGEVQEREVDIRIVAATNRDLEEEVGKGRFRADLFYRLGAATVWLPPLRDRPRELRVLADRFLEAACTRAGRELLRLSEPALRILAGYPWPGNARELKNAMDYLAATVTGAMALEAHLPERLLRGVAKSTEGAVEPVEDELRRIERKRMAEALESCGKSPARAARLIKMPLRTFYTKAKQYGLGRKGGE